MERIKTSNIKRILVVRTDRIGDVVLSIPAITALRKAFPDSYIAIMVSPITKDIVIDNPYINEVIVYDKTSRHRGVLKTLGFILWLRLKRFGIAFILHTTVRVNIITFLAGIPIRVGYKRGKMDFLLSHGLEYKKRLGEKHEAEYTLDVLRSVGIDAEFSLPFIVVKKEDEVRIDSFLSKYNLGKSDKKVLLHPGASCKSKMWPVENFARLGDILRKDFGVKIIINTAPDQKELGERLKILMIDNDKDVFLFYGKSLKELAALFKRMQLVISNDSGPVHIAAGVGTPVISIFGRNDMGLSPVRWRPLIDKSIVVHKEVGCVRCLAHNCKRDFLCLRSITPEEVADKAIRLLSGDAS